MYRIPSDRDCVGGSIQNGIAGRIVVNFHLYNPPGSPMSCELDPKLLENQTRQFSLINLFLLKKNKET